MGCYINCIKIHNNNGEKMNNNVKYNIFILNINS